MSMRRFLLLLSAAATLICPGCFKDVSDSTNYVLKPLVQNLSADPNNPLEGVRAYAFVADTALYTVASYEDALNGVVTSRTNSSDGSIRSPRRSPANARGRRAGSRCRSKAPRRR